MSYQLVAAIGCARTARSPSGSFRCSSACESLPLVTSFETSSAARAKIEPLIEGTVTMAASTGRGVGLSRSSLAAFQLTPLARTCSGSAEATALASKEAGKRRQDNGGTLQMAARKRTARKVRRKARRVGRRKARRGRRVARKVARKVRRQTRKKARRRKVAARVVGRKIRRAARRAGRTTRRRARRIGRLLGAAEETE